MSTKEEFRNAIALVSSCSGSVVCGCEVDEMQADWLYYQCKRYVENYKKRFMHC